MQKSKSNENSFLNYYEQIKQRIDLNIDMNSQKIIAQTKLTFLSKNENFIFPNKIPNFLYLQLNAENIYINDIKIIIDNNKNKKEGNNINLNEYMKEENLEFKNNSPVGYFKNYLDLLYQNIEELESYKNIKRIEWEIRQKGNLNIKIPKKFFIENISKNINNNNKKENLLNKKIKIIINYLTIEKNIGIIFQSYENKNNSNIICYTPNYYFNTQYWVPCIYDLNLQINWSLYLYIPDKYISYSSCELKKIIKNINGKKLIISKSYEKTIARNIGFIIIREEYFNICINKNIIIVGNKNKKEIIEKYMINNKLIETLDNYYKEFFAINYNNNITAIVFVPYLMFNNAYQSFEKFLKLKEDNYLNFIKFPFLYILPEKFIYNEIIPEYAKFQLKIISKIFFTNYIGGLIIEKKYADFWIINGLENWISYSFLNKLYNNNYIKIKIYKWLLKLRKECKKGNEFLPLYNNNFSNPFEIQVNSLIHLKCKIIFFILESKIGKKNIKNILNQIINERQKNGYNISTQYLLDKFNTNYGINLEKFFDIFVYKTGMAEVNFEYKYNNENNLFEYKIEVENIAKEYYEKNPFLETKNTTLKNLSNLDKKLLFVDSRVKSKRIFDFNYNLDIIYRNGIEIKKASYEINTLINSNQFFLPLINKKNEMTNIEKEFFWNLISNTGLKEIFNKEEIEKFFYKNVILWVKCDSEITFFRVNKIKNINILYEFIKLFKENDNIGIMESLYNIGKSKDNYDKSIKILKYLIKNKETNYKIKIYALKIYIKIIIKTKKDNEYIFLLKLLDNYFNELLKDKININSEIYYILLIIIKYLGEYKDDNFFQSSKNLIKDKIIDKLLYILNSNDLDSILNFDNCYFIGNIILIISKFKLKEKTFIFLDIILKILRIEKLKRSFNEILIINSFVALNNILISNSFFCEKKNILIQEIIENIFNEINFFINHECENYELIVILHYFQVFMEFYKSQSYIEFSNYLIKYILGQEYNNIVKMSNFSLSQNLSMISKIKSLILFFNNNNLIFDSPDEKINFLYSLKTILISPICYLREDCKIILEKLYKNFYNKKISKKGAGNNDFNNINFLHLLNKNRITFSDKKYPDSDWLFLINKDRISLNKKIEVFNSKYKNNKEDIFVIKVNQNNVINLNDLIYIIFNKFINYFVCLFNKEKDNESIILLNNDFDNIKNKILNNNYNGFNQFNNELYLIFNNYISLIEKNILIDKIKQLHEYYEIIIFKYKEIIFLKESMEINNKKIINGIIDDEQTISKFNNNNDKNEKFLNKKRNEEKQNLDK